MPTYLKFILFNAVVLVLLYVDLVILTRKQRGLNGKEALFWTCFWVVLALLFTGGLALWDSHEHALAFFTGYIIELSLSADNVFVFLIIFTYFQVPTKLQHRVLLLGIIGALVLRALFITLGITLLEHFQPLLYLFGLFLLWVGIQMLRKTQEEQVNIESNVVLKIARKWIPLTPDYHEEHFFIRQEGKLWMTPLFLVLLTVETTDLLFAVDSIPAVLAITLDPFLVYTSNVLAILGLRALYFSVAHLLQRLCYLRFGLAAILSFVGIKMLLSRWIHIPTHISLGFIVIVLFVTILCSLRKKTS